MPISIIISAENEAELQGYARLIGLMAALNVSKLTHGDITCAGNVSSEGVFNGHIDPVDQPLSAETAPLGQSAGDKAFAGHVAETEAKAAEPAKRTRRTKAEMALDKVDAMKAEPPAPVGPDEAAKLVHDKAIDGEVLAPGDKPVTLEFLREEMQRISTDFSVDATRALLAKFGIPRVGVLEAGRYAEFAEAAASWNGDSK